jgi:ATP-dependent DNA ligase
LRPHWATTPATDDSETLWRWACDQGIEGIVAKRLSEWYRPCERRWLKIKNRDYWRYPLEVAAARERISRRAWRPRTPTAALGATRV